MSFRPILLSDYFFLKRKTKVKHSSFFPLVLANLASHPGRPGVHPYFSMTFSVILKFLNFTGTGGSLTSGSLDPTNPPKSISLDSPVVWPSAIALFCSGSRGFVCRVVATISFIASAFHLSASPFPYPSPLLSIRSRTALLQERCCLRMGEILHQDHAPPSGPLIEAGLPERLTRFRMFRPS